MYEVSKNNATKKMMAEHTEWAVLVKGWEYGKTCYTMVATGNDKREVEEEGHFFYAVILDYEGYEFTVPTSEIIVKEWE